MFSILLIFRPRSCLPVPPSEVDTRYHQSSVHLIPRVKIGDEMSLLTVLLRTDIFHLFLS